MLVVSDRQNAWIAPDKLCRPRILAQSPLKLSTSTMHGFREKMQKKKCNVTSGARKKSFIAYRDNGTYL